MARPKSQTTPKPKRRLAISLDHDVSLALAEFSAVTGTAQASFVASIVLEALPIIRSITQASRLAKERPREALEIMREEMNRTQIKAAQAALDLEEKPVKKVRRFAPKKSPK